MTTTSTKPKVLGAYGTMYYVKDMKKALSFYKDTLGLKASFESPDWSEFTLHGHSLCLHPAGDKKNPPNGSLIIHVEGLKALVEDLKAKGAKVSEPQEAYPGAWFAELTDAEGNHLSYYEGPKGC